MLSLLILAGLIVVTIVNGWIARTIERSCKEFRELLIKQSDVSRELSSNVATCVKMHAELQSMDRMDEALAKLADSVRKN